MPAHHVQMMMMHCAGGQGILFAKINTVQESSITFPSPWGDFITRSHPQTKMKKESKHCRIFKQHLGPPSAPHAGGSRRASDTPAPRVYFFGVLVKTAEYPVPKPDPHTSSTDQPEFNSTRWHFFILFFVLVEDGTDVASFPLGHSPLACRGSGRRARRGGGSCAARAVTPSP